MPVISQRRITEFFRRSDEETSSQAKGKALEDLICYLFEKIPGISISKRNKYNALLSEEIDIAFWNTQNQSGLYFLPNVILVECKNWSQPLASQEVNWFDSKLRNRALSYGILVAANGLTGDSEQKNAAHHIVDRALAEGRRLIVLTRSEIVALSSTQVLVKLVQEKLCELAVAGSIFGSAPIPASED